MSITKFTNVVKKKEAEKGIFDLFFICRRDAATQPGENSSITIPGCASAAGAVRNKTDIFRFAKRC